MNIHTKIISLFTLMVAIFFIHTSITSALITCPGRPAANLDWSSSNCTTLSPGYDNNTCFFSGANGSKSIPNGTSCSVSLSCTGPGGSAGPASDSLEYHPELTWDGSSCVTQAAKCTAPLDTNPVTTDPTAIANYCGPCAAGTHQPSSLSCHSGNTPGWTEFKASPSATTCTAPYCGGCGCIANIYSISASAGSGGSISPSGTTQVTYNGSAGYSITANSGYAIASVTVDGSNQGAIGSYTFSNVQSNHSISASFSVIPTGSWSYPSACPTSCGQLQTTQTQTCSGGNSKCSGSAASRTCSATAACTANTNCVGSWSNNGTCSVSGACGQTGTVQQTYSIDTPQSGTGTACPYTDGTTRWGSTSCSTDACSVSTPTASLSVSPSSITSGSQSTITWSSSDADSCTAGGAWTNSGNLSGSGWTGPLTSDTTYTFQCTGPGGTSALQSATVTVTAAPTCGNGANNYPSCNRCSAPQVWNGSSSSCNGSLGITVSPASYSSTLPDNTITASYTLTSGNSSNTTCRLLDNVGSPLTSYSSCNGNMSVTTPSAGGTYGYYVQAYKSQTGETLTSNNFTVSITDASVYGCTTSGANNYNPSANVNDGSCCYGWTSWNGSSCVAPTSQITAFNVEPRMSTLGITSTLSWDVKYPTNTCTLTATTVCQGGHSSCTASQLASETALNQTFQTGNTDTNDVYGASRPILSALRTVASPSTTNARGKKTLQISNTTDILLTCGSVSKKIRFLVTTNNEG